MNIFDTILFRPMGWLLNWFFELTGNMGIAILLLTITVNILLFPLSVRQQRQMAKQTALKPKLDRLREKYADNQQKLSQEMQNLYTTEGVSMTGGCLTSLLRLPFLIGIYTVIRSPLKYLLGLGELATPALSAFKATLASGEAAKISGDLYLMSGKGFEFISSNEAYASLVDAVKSLDLNFLGLNLGEQPSIREPNLLWIFPVFSFLMAFLSTMVSLQQNKKNNPEAARMGGIMYFMPFMSLYIAFIVHAALGLYWGFSSIVTTIIQVIVNKYYGPYITLAQGYKKTVNKRKDYEKKKKESRNKIQLN